MCLAILKTADSVITRRELKNGFDTNDDGAGFMFTENRKLVIQKGYFGFRKFYKAFRQAERENPKSNFVIHFRLATSGKKDSANCHPFLVKNNEEVGFAHNGIFSGLGNNFYSDTMDFNYRVLKTMPKSFMYSVEAMKFISKYCGWYNKLIFLNSNNHYIIINEDMGYWKNGVWFSNGFSNSTWRYNGYVYDLENTEEDEKIIWNSCDICNGFYPEEELDLLEDRNLLVCESCKNLLEAKYKKAECFYCGNIVEIIDDKCSNCGIDVDSGWLVPTDLD